MKNIYNIIRIFPLAAFIILIGQGCSKILDTKEDTGLTDENIASSYSRLFDFGYAAYMRLPNGFNSLDGNLTAAVSDEAEYTQSPSETQMFNEGSWSAFNNPDNVYSYFYEGIRAANYFLENSVDYKTILYRNRDTLSDNGNNYRRDVRSIAWLRAENRVLRAFYYFELAKRHGGVPLVTKVLNTSEETRIPRASADEVFNFIVSEIEAVKDSLQTDWGTFEASLHGRITLGMAIALKSRALLYAASPLFNTENNIVKWENAAAAANELLQMNSYSLDGDYRNLFLADNTAKSPETIFAVRVGAGNTLEKANYPITTPGGNTGVTPSHNLVSAYEYKGTPDPANPYAERDPRLHLSIVTNNSTWNGRIIRMLPDSTDDYRIPQTSKTGYYLKKFLNDGLDLNNEEKKLRTWIIFRLGEIYLNYAEAMNEAYGPDDDHGYGLTARQAINIVRNRPNVEMPAITALSKEQFRAKVKHERRIELAFEDHRYWDLKRWMDAATTLSQPLLGVRPVYNNGITSYNVFEVEKRVFIAPKMYLYPIPQSEVIKSNGVVVQNPGW